MSKENERSNLQDGAGLAASGYIAKKTATNLAPGALGLRTEEHTTSKKNAEKILKDGGKLDPEKGGSKGGASDSIDSDEFRKNSKKYVHITGANDKKNVRTGIGSAVSKRMQRLMYHTVYTGGKDIEGGLKKVVTGRTKARTLYTSNPDSHYSKNYKVDEDSGFNGLKSKSKETVHSNRISAAIAGVKKHGLKGIKENKGRAAAYAGATLGGLELARRTGKDAYNSIKDKLSSKKKKD